jgi:hypothetical protein
MALMHHSMQRMEARTRVKGHRARRPDCLRPALPLRLTFRSPVAPGGAASVFGLRTSDSAGGERPWPGDDGSPPPSESDDLLAAALTPSNTFRTDSGSVITETMCRRPRQRGQRRTSSPNTLLRKSAQRIYLWPFDGSPALIAASSSATSTSFGSFRTTGRGTT